MAGYGYTTYRVASYGYNTSSSGVRGENIGGPVTKPFAPYVPNINNGNGNGNGTSEGHVTRKKIVPVASRPYDSDSEESDDEWKHPQTSPVRGSPRKVEASHPPSSTSPDWRHYSSQPKPYYNGYGGDYETNNKPIGGTINKRDGYVGDYGGRKPIESTIRNNNKYDGTNGYDDYGGHKEGRKPIHDGYNGYGADYDGNGGYGDYNNKEGPKPKPKTKPPGSPVYNNGYAEGYSLGNGNNNKDRGKPYDHDIDSYDNYYNNNKAGPKQGGPIPTSGWTETPRKGTLLSKVTNDIGEAMGLLMKEGEKVNGNGKGKGNERGYNGGPKPYEYENNPHQRRHDGPGPLQNRPAPATSNYDKKGMDLVNETERLKNIVTAAPQIQSHSSVPRPNGNFNLSSSARPPFNFRDGRASDYDNRVINHEKAAKIYNGTTV